MFRPFLKARVEPLEPRTLYAASSLPRPDHVVVVIEENQSQQAIIGSPDAPYINSLAAQGASFTDYHAVTHPSQPNYLALFSGSTQGFLDDTPSFNRITAPSLGGQLVGAGLEFGGYSEDLPYAGYAWPSYRNYNRRHNPWVNFADVPYTDNLPFRSFPRPGYFESLPTVSFVVPNLVNDMHDGPVAQADEWLRTRLDPYVRWAKTHNSLLVLTFDEDDAHEGNRIPTIVVGAGVEPGNYSTPYTHYSLLRTMEDLYDLAPLGAAADANPITDVWQAPEKHTMRLAPVADTFAWAEVPDQPLGTSTLLDVKTSNNAGQSADAYLKFDAGAIAANDVASVKLRFYGALSGVDRVTTGVYAIADNSWSESSLTWNKRPAMGALLGTTVVVNQTEAWYEVDATDYVRGRRAAGASALSFGLHNPLTSTPRFRFHSREAADFRPELLVVRKSAVAPLPAEPLTPALSPGYRGEGVRRRSAYSVLVPEV